MLIFPFLLTVVLSTTSITITEPVDGDTYDGDWLAVRAIVENENELPDSVHYTLNGEPVIQIPRLSTDWPTYMQNYQNHGYSESPAPLTNEVLWTAPVTGDIHEFPTPVVVDGIVYYPQDSSGDSLYALDAATGEILWKYRTGSTDDPVTVHNGRVYTPSDSLWCLDALTGERMWAFGESNAMGGTPIVTDNSVFCAAGFSDKSTAYSSIVYRLDPLSGEVEWSQGLIGETVSCMAAWNNMLFIPTFTYNEFSAIYALDQETGEVIWGNTDSYQGYWDCSPVIVDNTIYITGLDGIGRAINASSGVTIWETTVAILEACPTLSYYNGLLYHPTACLDAANGTAVWERSAITHGSTGIAANCLYYGDLSSIVCLNCSDGSEVWSYQINTGPIGLVSSPSIVDGVMYYAGTDWNLYAFGTGLKYTYLDDLFAKVGANELIVTSFDGGAVAADTINFIITGTGIDLEASRLFNLSSSPNPFVSTASISFELSQSGFTSVEIFDLSGRQITSLVNSEMIVGTHSLQWNGCSKSGEEASAGLYLCRIESGGVIETAGLCLLR